MRLYRHLLLCCAVLLSMVFIHSAWGGDPTLRWIKRSRPTGHMLDAPSRIVVDGSGNVLVAGTMEGKEGRARYVTTRYLPDGAVDWQRLSGSFPSTLVSGLAVDASGSVIVSGCSNGQFLTIKYDAEGNETWSRRYRSGTGYVDEAVAVAVGSDGSVYVAGNSTPPGGMSDFLVVKYDADGTVVWTNRYDGTAGKADVLKAMAVDNQGNVCLAGKSQDSSGVFTLLVVKVDRYGELFWVDSHSGDAGGPDKAQAIAVDADRNVYVAGTSAGETGTDVVVMMISGYGERLWTSRYDGPSHGDDEVRSVALGPLGEIYVAGWSHDAATGDDLLALRYDENGALAWDFRQDGPAHGEDRAFDVAVDPYGKVVVTGSSATGTGDETGIVILGLDTDGRSLWTRRINMAPGFTSRPTGLALHGSTAMYLTGPSTRADGWDNILNAGYGQAPLWENIPFNATLPEDAVVALDRAGNPHILYTENPEGFRSLLRYARYDGTRWVKHIVEPEGVFQYAMVIDALDRVHITYRAPGVLKYAFFDGTEWSVTTVAESVGAHSLAVDSSNRPHIAFVGLEYDRTSTLRYASHDGATWNTEALICKVQPSRGISLALTPSGKAHITVLAIGFPYQLCWVTNVSGAWDVSPIDNGNEAALVLDGAGRPHVLYRVAGTDQTRYARHNGRRWIIEDLMESLHLPSGNYGSFTLCMDKRDVPHVSMVLSEFIGQPLLHARRTSAGWAYDVVDKKIVSASMAGSERGIFLAYLKRLYDEDDTWALLVTRRTR